MVPSSLAHPSHIAPRWLRVAVTSVFLVWAAYWAWFLAASTIAEGKEGLIGHLPMLAVLIALVLAVWRKPLWGGVAMCALGVVAVIAILHPVGRFTFAAPLLVFGAYYAWLGWKGRRA